MALVALIVLTIVDLALAALVIAVSGFLVGSGPESMHGGATIEAALVALVASCVLAPIVGFAMRSFGRPVGGILVTLLPLAGAAFLGALMP
jgi:hypothetical protein